MATIELTTVPPSYLEEEIQKPYPYSSQDEIFLKLFNERFANFQDESDAMFNDWLRMSNAQLIKDLDDFVNDALGNKKNFYFENVSPTLNVATVVLGLHTSDHLPTIDMIEEHVSKKSKKIQIIRLNSELEKKSNLIGLFEETEYRDDTFVIVERIETFKPQLLEALIVLLSDALRNKKTTSVMLMICMSGSWTNVTEVLPPGCMNMVGKRVELVKQSRATSQVLLMDLLKGIVTQDLKFGPHVYEFLDMNLIEKDASLTNLKYLLQHAAFHHFWKRASVLSSTKQQLKQIPKKELLETFRKIPSIKKNSIKPPANLIDYCSVLCFNIDQYHTFLTNQMNYYFILLRDETKIHFPCDAHDIYIELLNHSDLSRSSRMADAIERLKKSPPGRVLQRIEASIKEYHTHPEKLDDCLDIYMTLCTTEKYLRTAKDKAGVIAELIEKLHLHIVQLKSPKGLLLNETKYLYDEKLLQETSEPAIRREVLRQYAGQSSDLATLYHMIHGSSETLGLSDLYEDFKSKLDRNDQDEGTMKAVFLDLVEHLEHIGLIKQVRTGKKDQMKRLVWLS